MNVEQIKLVREDCAAVLGQDLNALKALQDQSILITGGTGFMGSWLSELLCYLNESHAFGTRVFLLSRSSQELSARMQSLLDAEKVKLIRQDIRSLLELPDEITHIIHAAGSPDSRQHASDPIRTISVISAGTEAILSAASRLRNLTKLINISSGLVYGAQPLEEEAINEDFKGALQPWSVSAAYAESKRLAETLVCTYRNQFRLPIVNVRPFAFVGPYQLLDKPWAINNFVRDGLLGGPIRIQGDGHTVRSYMYGADMAFWLLKMLLDGASGACYNLGSSSGIALADLAAKISALLPNAPAIELRPLGVDSTRRSRWVPDTRRAQSELGLKLHFDIDKALRRTILWHQMGR